MELTEETEVLASHPNTSAIDITKLHYQKRLDEVDTWLDHELQEVSNGGGSISRVQAKEVKKEGGDREGFPVLNATGLPDDDDDVTVDDVDEGDKDDGLKNSSGFDKYSKVSSIIATICVSILMLILCLLFTCVIISRNKCELKIL